MAGAQIGAECNVCDHTYIEGDVIIGDRVTLKSGVFLWDGLRVEDDVFIGPQATFTNDIMPRSRQPFELRYTTLRRGASIGAGAVILPGVTVGEGAMVGAGAVVTKDVRPTPWWWATPPGPRARSPPSRRKARARPQGRGGSLAERGQASASAGRALS